jgi:hypothetical protein
MVSLQAAKQASSQSPKVAHCEGVVQGTRCKEHVEGGGGMEAGQYRPSAMCVGRCMSNDKVWICNTRQYLRSWHAEGSHSTWIAIM